MGKPEEKPMQFVHGECNLFQLTGDEVIPEGAVRVKPDAENMCATGFIIGQSETSGNHHTIDLGDENEDVEVYMNKENTQMYLNVKKPVQIRCLHEGRHDEMTLPAGQWKRNISQEHDHITQAKRNVAD